jgi:hypothetical protein
VAGFIGCGRGYCPRVINTRIAALTALLLLVAGCSTTTSRQRPDPATAPAPSSSAMPTTTAGSAPARGASYADVLAWVQAGRAAAAEQFRTAKAPDGTATTLHTDVAFNSPTGKIKCITDFDDSVPGLSCLVDLRNPPSKPAGSDEGEFIAGWIYYTGSQATVGSLHGDPAPFVRGYGNQLAYGSRVSAGDYTCRMDTAGLFCVDRSTRSAVALSDAGVVPFGCLRKQSPTQDVGELYGC